MRDNDNIFLDGVKYEIEKISDDEEQDSLISQLEPPKDFYNEVEALCTRIKDIQCGLAQNMFYNPKDRKEIRDYVEKLNKEIANVRIDISKTYSYE